MFTRKELLCSLIFALILTEITYLLRKELLAKGKNIFPLIFIIAVVLFTLMNVILRAL